MNLGDLLKDLVLPVAIGAVTGPGVGAGIGKLFGTSSAISPFLTRAGTSFLTSKVMGGKNKDALRNALLGGVAGMAFDNFTGPENVATDVAERVDQVARNRMTDPMAQRQGTGAFSGTSTVPAEQANKQIAESFKPKTFTGELLKAGGLGEDNLLARLLNTRMGEGLTAGLLAQLLAGDDEEDTRREFERRPFGQGGPGGQLGGIRFAADGGQMGFPRRNGGIDPSEGSGTKDDVPAMLMAGEFVLTKDAVKGLGDGNQRKGIQRAYNMMDNLEARA
jgi:hypothetical protein